MTKNLGLTNLGLANLVVTNLGMNNLVMKHIKWRYFLIIFSVNLMGCDAFSTYESDCKNSENTLTINTKRNNAFYQTISFDSAGGVSFNRVNSMKSATALSSNVAFTYNENSKLLRLAFKNSERLVNNLDSTCVQKLQSFITTNGINAQIELIDN